MMSQGLQLCLLLLLVESLQGKYVTLKKHMEKTPITANYHAVVLVLFWLDV